MKKLIALLVTPLGALAATAQLNPLHTSDSGEDMVEFHNQAVSASSVENFQVVLDGDQAHISWSTRTLEKTRGFLLEKSTNGNEFESMLFVAAESS